jgi:hypothetical protein
MDYSVVIKDLIGNIYPFYYPKNSDDYKILNIKKDLKSVLREFLIESIQIDIMTVNDQELSEIVVLSDMTNETTDLSDDKPIKDNMDLFLFIRNPVKEMSHLKYRPIYGVNRINQNKVMDNMIKFLENRYMIEKVNFHNYEFDMSFDKYTLHVCLRKYKKEKEFVFVFYVENSYEYTLYLSKILYHLFPDNFVKIRM